MPKKPEITPDGLPVVAQGVIDSLGAGDARTENALAHLGALMYGALAAQGQTDQLNQRLQD